MIYRTAHRASYRHLNENLGALSYRIAQLTNQIASEKRINTPSDDPSGAATVLGTRSALSSIKQYSTNIAVSDLWLTDSGSAIQSITETLDQIYAKTEQGATDTYSANQRQIIADEVAILFQSLLQYGDTKIGDSYIFGGQKVTTQPFSLQVEAQKVIAGCQNSDKWTGKVVNYGDAKFNNRKDLPIQSQDFLIEVVRAGGIDSRYYSNTSSTGSGFIEGGDYKIKIEAADKRYNNLSVKVAAGPKPQTTTGSAADNTGITWGGTTSPTKIVYTYGTAGATTASWNAADNTLTVALETNSSAQSVATADDIVNAANAAVPGIASLTGGNTGAGRVDPLLAMEGQSFIGYNYGTYAEKNGDEITVYLQRDNATGSLVADAAAVKSAIDAVSGGQLNVSISGNINGLVSPQPVATTLSVGTPYTLAQVTADPKGTQNDLIWSIKNHTANIGAAGNDFSLAYVIPENPFDPNGGLTYDPATKQITVNVAVDADIYSRVFAQVYNDPKSGAYQNSDRANEMALKEAIKTTGKDVMAMAAAHPDLKDLVDVKLADGNSGDGKINAFPRTNFSEGYDGPALFRVSQDGGKTWGPPMSFSASEYMTGDMFYNSTLGHASLTTGIPGKANDLVFTAKQMGTWGNDVRVEYQLPQPPQSSPSITVGPNPWNICVSLGTDAAGNITTTANDIMKLINNHPEASQLVTADLANYHEGGGGTVDIMECKSLSVGEPYQVNGKSVITPLGYATGTVKFGYDATTQSDPNIVFQALQQGPGGNDIGIRYTTSADPTYYTPPEDANDNCQGMTTVRYETDAKGKTVVVVHLAAERIPHDCPEGASNPNAAPGWNEAFPLSACTTDHGFKSIATAGSVVQAIIDKNMQDPANAVVWPSLERWPQGWDSTALVGATESVTWLTGGNDTEDASNHGVNLRFIPDGTALQVGDVFEVPVGWYRGDDKNLDINASSNYRTTMNIPGNELFGGNGQGGNILDTVQRLVWALEHNDSEMVGRELPQLKAAIEQVTTLETKIGTRQIRNQFVLKNLEQSQFNAETLLSTVEDADFSKLITDLKNAQTVYEACLGATGLTNKASLLNYI